MRLKKEGVLSLCIVVVLAKTSFEKFASKVRRLVDNLFPVKSFVRQLDVLSGSSFNVYLYCAKISVSIF